MHAFLLRGGHDLGRREADALIDHIHAGIARAHRDLFGAVGVTVEAGLSYEKFEPSAELLRDQCDLCGSRKEIIRPSNEAIVAEKNDPHG